MIWGFILFTVAREIVFSIQINRLLNKLMSRNYQEYRFNQELGKDKKKPEAPPKEEISDEFGVLDGIGLT